jgi:integrase
MRIILVACGNWAEGRGYLVKGGSPFPAMVRYKETKAPVSIFTPENMASLLSKADETLRPFLALGAFAGLRMAELQRLDWNEIDLERGFIRGDQLSLSIQGDPRPDIAISTSAACVLLLGSNEAPDFIELNAGDCKIAHFFIHEFFASRSDAKTEAANCILMNARHALDAADTGAFRESVNRHDLFFEREDVCHKFNFWTYCATKSKVRQILFV